MGKGGRVEGAIEEEDEKTYAGEGLVEGQKSL